MPHFLLYIHPRPSAHGIVLPRFMASLPTFVLNYFEIPQRLTKGAHPLDGSRDHQVNHEDWP